MIENNLIYKIAQIKNLTTKFINGDIDKNMKDLQNELKNLEDDINMSYEGSPTKKIDYNIASKFIKLPKDKRLGLYQSTTSIDKIKHFTNNNEWYCGVCFKGVETILKYENGKLKNIIINLNDDDDIDIIDNAFLLKNLPENIPHENNLEIRGKIIVKKEIDSSIMNIITESDKNKIKHNNLYFYAYNCLSDIGVNDNPQKLIMLNALGFDVSPFVFFEDDDNPDVDKAINTLKNEVFSFDVCGLFFEVRKNNLYNVDEKYIYTNNW